MHMHAVLSRWEAGEEIKSQWTIFESSYRSQMESVNTNYSQSLFESRHVVVVPWWLCLSGGTPRLIYDSRGRDGERRDCWETLKRLLNWRVSRCQTSPESEAPSTFRPHVERLYTFIVSWLLILPFIRLDKVTRITRVKYYNRTKLRSAAGDDEYWGGIESERETMFYEYVNENSINTADCE